MSEIRYSKEHEWVRVDGEVATVGISEHAQQQLGDVVFVELPEVGREVARSAAMAVVESVKAASDVYAPVSGRVVEVNDALNEDPALVNSDAEGAGWFCKLEMAKPDELGDLMDADAYRTFAESQS
jgi:glycine cleavage system H protein